MRKIILILITLSFFDHSFGNEHDEFFKAYQQILKGDFVEGITLLKRAADNNSAQAALELSRIYKDSAFISADYDVACEYASRAANLGSIGGKFHVADCLFGKYAWNELSEDKRAQIIILFQEAIDGGYYEWLVKDLTPIATYLNLPPDGELRLLAKSLLNSVNPMDRFWSGAYLTFYPKKGGEKDWEAFNAVSKVASLGYPEAITGEAVIGIFRGYEYDSSKIFKLLQRGYYQLVWALGYLSTGAKSSIFSSYNLSENDKEIARKSLEIVSTWKSPIIQHTLSKIFEHGSDELEIKVDPVREMTHLELCVEAHAGSQKNVYVSGCAQSLGDIWWAGFNGQQDKVKAFQYHKLADITGTSYLAKHSIGTAYLYGWGTDIDYSKAIEYLTAAHEMGYNYSSNFLGEIYEKGLGTEIDYKKAVFFYRHSYTHDDKNMWAMSRVASLIDRKLVPGDLREAASLYRKVIALPDIENSDYYIPEAKARLPVVENRIARESKQLGSLNYGDYHALLIGINDYKYLKDLKTPLNDVQRLGDILDKNFGFDVQILENASRDTILRELANFRNNLEEQDNLLIYYAGHGYLDAETGVGFWQPAESEPDIDSAWIPTDRITRTLKGIKSNNIAVISDSCFAGTILRGGDQSRINVNDSIAVQRLVEKKTRVALASGGLEPVPDNLSNGENSVFASQLIFALEESNQVTTATDLFMSIQKRVIGTTARLGFKQSPEFSALYESGHEGGDFVFVKK